MKQVLSCTEITACAMMIFSVQAAPQTVQDAPAQRITPDEPIVVPNENLRQWFSEEGQPAPTERSSVQVRWHGSDESYPYSPGFHSLFKINYNFSLVIVRRFR